MKYLIILVFITHSYAGSMFWKNVDQIEKEFYQIEVNKNDQNSTSLSENINDILDKKYTAFNELLITLKQQPYDLKLENDFEIKNIKYQLMKLQEKIKINKHNGNNLAVIRDEITTVNIILRDKIREYFTILANDQGAFNADRIHNINKEYTEYLATLKYNYYLDLYNKIKLIDGDVENRTKEMLIELHKHYNFMNDILIYIEANQTRLVYKSLTSFLKLDVIIKEINSNIIFSKINPYLRFIHLDSGRLILFITLIIMFFLD